RQATRFWRSIHRQAISTLAFLAIAAGSVGRADDQSAAKTDAPAVDPAVAQAIDQARQTYWAFQPVKERLPPTVKDAAWPLSPVDHFILARLEEKGLKPVPVADKRALIRRATFDLVGLPPAPEATDAFLADDSQDAFTRVVDGLLAS